MKWRMPKLCNLLSMKTQTKVQQVKTKKNWYHVSSSKMSAKAEGYSLLDMDTRLPLYRWLFNGHNVLDPLATIVIIISSWWGCCTCRLLSDVIFISLLAVASDTNDKIRTVHIMYQLQGNDCVDEHVLATWKLVEHFVNGLDGLVSCPQFLLHLQTVITNRSE